MPGAVEIAGLDSAIPPPVRRLLRVLWAGGHAAWVVGGSLRDVLLGRPASDWDLATDATPDRMLELFPTAVYENRFGTVVVREAGGLYEITTFRADVGVADHRRPDRIEFARTIEDDLARRDFTVNALAWGSGPGEPDAAGSLVERAARLVDPFGGLPDLESGILRAVGDPVERFHEDALRMVRAVRLATVLDFAIDPATLEAIGPNVGLVAHLSWERLGAEMTRLMAADRPSAGLRLLVTTGLVGSILPELVPQQGLPQNKLPGEDLWDHTLRTVDATAAERGPAAGMTLRWAALLHDVGKPDTFADGHFVNHERVGARIAAAVLERLHVARERRDRIVRLVEHHMFTYDPAWSDAAVRRFIRAVGPDLLDELAALRAADNVGSGLPWDAGHDAELFGRCRRQLGARVALGLRDLAVNGNDLMAEFGLQPGPELGILLHDLLERVTADPALNERAALLAIVRESFGRPG